MFILIIIVVSVIGIYFAFRYFILLSSLRKIREDLKEIQKDFSQNQMLFLPAPNQDLGELVSSINEFLEKIQKERNQYEKREREFQKQIENISHDLRTPLTVILGNIKIIKKSSTSSFLSPDVKETIEIIENKGESMKKLIGQFYDYSRLNSSDFVLKTRPADAARLLRETLMGNYQVLAQANIDVQADIPDKPIWVLADDTALERIYENLLQNTGRYAASFLHIAIQQAETDVCISFQNDTELLTGEDLPRLFDRFYMQDAARSQGGTGLGLTVAKLLAEQMGGELKVLNLPQKSDGARLAICFELHMNPCHMPPLQL